MMKNKKIDEDSKAKSIKMTVKKVNENLFPPLMEKTNKLKINVLINNKYIFPKVGILGNESKPCYVGHIKPVTKIVFINQNILCSTSQESLVIKIWNLNNFNAICHKNILVNFIIADMIHANENNLVVCGEKLILLNIETEEQTIIFKPSFGNYIEYNLLAKVNNNVGVASSLGGYFLIFNLNNGKKIKKIEMNKIHFICNSEDKKRKIKNEFKEQEKNEENEENEDENNDKKIIDVKQDLKNEIGSSKCLKTEKGHKGPVYCIIGLNNDSYKDCIISGGFDNFVKIFDIHNDNKIINLVGHENTVTALTLSDSKKFLFSSSFDFTVRKWNLEDCTCDKIIKYDPGIQNILLPMIDDYLLTIGYDGRINIWNEEGLMIKSYYFQHGAITSGIIFPHKKESEKNIFVFADHTGEIFIKQIIVGDENIKKFNKLKKSEDSKNICNRKGLKNKEK